MSAFRSENKQALEILKSRKKERVSKPKQSQSEKKHKSQSKRKDYDPTTPQPKKPRKQRTEEEKAITKAKAQATRAKNKTAKLLQLVDKLLPVNITSTTTTNNNTATPPLDQALTTFAQRYTKKLDSTKPHTVWLSNGDIQLRCNGVCVDTALVPPEGKTNDLRVKISRCGGKPITLCRTDSKQAAVEYMEQIVQLEGPKETGFEFCLLLCKVDSDGSEEIIDETDSEQKYNDAIHHYTYNPDPYIRQEDAFEDEFEAAFDGQQSTELYQAPAHRRAESAVDVDIDGMYISEDEYSNYDRDDYDEEGGYDDEL